MRAGNPIEAVASSLYSALLVDLPEVEYDSRRYKQVQDNEPPIIKKRRPYEDEVEVYCFPQMWGSTALGFGGMGGAAMTNAYTIVVIYKHVTACVYFEGRFAYAVEGCIPEEFWQDLRASRMPSVADAIKKYQIKNEE